MRSEKEKLIQREREIYNAGKRKIYIYIYRKRKRERAQVVEGTCITETMLLI